ncbi:MAG: PilZ domain-containing protein [Candidatus Omnitrophica bacterium]|jgi:hypothetical protein|nr:PilZ domain-containing protein [Candidatus Omnitrophota bacterium]
MPNHRRAGRWEVNRQAKIKLAGAYAFADCNLKNLGFRGMQVITKIKFPAQGLPFHFSLSLTSDIVLDIEGKVAWQQVINGYSIYGVYFIKITDKDKEKMYQFIHNDFSRQVQSTWWPDKEIKNLEKGGEAMEKDRLKDRRIFARFPAHFPARFLDASSNKEGRATACDVSAKGVGLVLGAELPAHTPVELWLDIPDQGEPLYTRGEVAWSQAAAGNAFRCGINLERADLMGLARVLRV